MEQQGAGGDEGVETSTERALRAAREELRAVVEHVDVGVVVHAADTSILVSNARASEILGLTPEQMRGKVAVDPTWSFLRDDGTPMPIDEYPVRVVVDSLRPITNLVVGIRHPGAREDTWVLVAAYPEIDAEGHLGRVVVTFSDITEQRRSTAELVAIAMVSRIFHDPASRGDPYPEIACRLAAKLRFPIATVELLDPARDELVVVGSSGAGAPAVGRRVPVDAAPCGAVVRRRAPIFTGDASAEPADRAAALRRAGVATLVCVPIVVDDHVAGTLAVADTRPRERAAAWVGPLAAVAAVLSREVGRRKAEEALRASEQKYRRLHESMTDAFVAVRMDGTILEWNRAYQQMLGYTEDELRSLRYVDVTPQRWHALETDIVQNAVLRHGSSGVYEKEYRRKDGTVFPIELRTFLVRDRDGEPDAMWAIVRDVSERKRSEEALLRTQKLEALGTLAGGVAHDFNNVLVALRGHAALAAELVPAGSAARAHLDEIARAGLRATALVQRILGFARPQKSVSIASSLAPILDESLGLLRAAIPSLVELRARWGDDVPASSVDPVQVQQVVVNVVNNAVDAIGGRPGVVELRLDRAEVAEGDAAIAPGTYARLSIHDDGCGMDAATLERVFDPFFTTKPVGKGTGLGLSTVHGIMKSHGGAVAIASQPGRGTKVELYFPAAPPSATSVVADETRAPPRIAARVERILYVDDEDSILFIARRLLERDGYRVATFEAPRDALAAFEARPGDFDALVSDISMPMMSGFDLAAAVLALRPGIPVVLTSGYVRPEDEIRARQLGVVAVLPKPTSVDELVATLDHIFQSAAPA